MNCYIYKNFINKDPILDWFNYNKISGNVLYRRDDEFSSFDKELLLETYTSKYKKIFLDKIKNKFKNDVTWLLNDTFVINNRRIRKHFALYNGPTEGSSLFTIEYTTLNVLKNGQTSSTHRWYNFKNWYYNQEYKIKYNITNSYILGRKYKGSIVSNRFDNLAYNDTDFSETLKDAENHLQTIHLRNDFKPNFNNKADFPWHHSKKLYKTINETTPEEQFCIKNNLKLELPKLGSSNIYIDYEMLTSVYDDFSKFPYSNEKVYVFNIGVYRNHKFNTFYAKELHQEYEMFKKFINYLNNVDQDNLVMFHWTNVEKRIFNEKLLEYPDLILQKQVSWFDLHDYFIKSEVTIGGCNDRKLKNICRVLHQNAMIKTKWDNGLIYDGLGSMTGYLKYLKTKDETILTNIIDYNRVDCKVLYEIHELLLSL